MQDYISSVFFIQFQHLTDELLTPYSEEAFSNRSPGTICQFHGKYRYGTIPLLSSCSNLNLDYVQLPYYEIPKRTCQVQDNVLGKCTGQEISMTSTLFLFCSK